MDAPHALARRVVASRARRNPSWATLSGLSGHDHRLRDASRAAFEDEAAEVEGLLREADALGSGLDAKALRTALRLDLFELREARLWAKNPDLVSEYFDHLFSLLLVAHLDAEARAEALASRLEGAADFFEAGWARFDAALVPPLWVEGAKLSLDGASAFLDAVREAARATAAEARVEAASPVVAALVARHGEWLDALHARARGEAALGERRFAQLLKIRRIDDAPGALVDMGERAVARFRGEMEEAAGTVLAEAGRSPGDDAVAEAIEVVRADHPRTFSEVLAEYRASIAAARAFVVERGLATMTDVPLDVVETPPFLRHLIPFAAYVGPARFAAEKRGVYLVTPKAELSSFARADTRNVTVHEAFPGHHLQISTATEKASLAAFLCDVPDLAEGWALYCEWLMGAHGYTAAPAERLIRARDARWRAVRVVLDVSLHTGAISATDAAARLAAETGMSVEEAAAEVLRYTQTPAYNLSYAWGFLQLERLREKALAPPRSWSERRFHDEVLRLGSIPIALVREALDIRQD